MDEHNRLEVQAEEVHRPPAWVIAEFGTRKPFLRLRGRWLKEAGFDIRTDCEVKVEDGRIMIEPAESEQKSVGSRCR